MNISQVSISPAAPLYVTSGQTVNLQCSGGINPQPLPAGTSTPEFEWFFGQTFNQPLTPSTTTNSGSTYTSTYSITSVSESDGGMYTCRLRGNHRTAISTTITGRFLNTIIYRASDQLIYSLLYNYKYSDHCIHHFLW